MGAPIDVIETRRNRRLLVNIVAGAVVMSSCGSQAASEVSDQSALPSIPDVGWSVSDADGCSDSALKDRADFPRDPSHDIALSTFLGDVDRWVE